MNCPHCGNQIHVTLSSRRSDYGDGWPNVNWQRKYTEMRPMADSSRWYGESTETTPDFTEAKRISPARPASIESDVGVPLAQAFITSIVVAIGSGGLAIAFRWPAWIVPAAWGTTLISTWVFLLVDHRSMLKTVETIINRDLDGDKQIGQSKPPPIRVEYEDHKDGRNRELWANLEPPKKTGYAGVISFARAVITGESFSERTAADAGYSRDEWKQDMRQIFIDNEWAIWNHPTEERQGVTLLAAGKAVLRQVASEGMPREDWITDD